ncbi:hypothetical protein JXR93_14665 [bacterium]|nr:hypothetical protein [bacterium]
MLNIEFLKLFLIFILLSISVFGKTIAPKNSAEPRERKTQTKKIENRLEFQKDRLNLYLKKYGVTAYVLPFEGSSYANKWSKWDYLTEADGKKLKKYVDLFIQEWSKYPVEWVKKSNLKAIAFVKNLNVVKQNRAAMPDAYGEVLYFDIGYDIYGELYQRSTIHHEYYHMIEENYFGSFYYKDPKWNEFNEKGFEYKGGGYLAYEDNEYQYKNHPKKGFVDTYSMYGLEEDKAQVYSYLMTTEYYEKFIEWVKTDSILKNKMVYMRDFIKDKCDEMDDDYFKKIHSKIKSK